MFRLVFLAELTILMSLTLVFSTVCLRTAKAQSSAAHGNLRKEAIAVLRTAMKEGTKFEKVHAAEVLLWTGQSEGVLEYFLEQDRTASSVPGYRIGIWRVLYQVNVNRPAVQEEYFQKILAVFSDAKASDQGTAAETLGKLKYAGRTKLVLDLAEHGKDDVRISARWILANSGAAEDEARLTDLLRSTNPKDRLYAAYALRHMNTLRPPTLKLLQELTAEESANGEVRYYVLGTLYKHLFADQRDPIKKNLLAYVADGNTDQRYESCMALAKWPTEDMIPVVEKLLSNKPLDERVGGAYVLLKIGQSHNQANCH